MTLTFKDPNGVEWQLWAWPLDGKFDARLAEPADLLAALGQLSTGGDGPTDAKRLRELAAVGFFDTLQADISTPLDDAEVDGLRTVWNDGHWHGRCLGEQKQAARVRELEAELAEVKRHSRNQRGQLNRFNRQVREDYEALPLRHQLESELAATKAKLAEVERELASALRVSEGRARQRDELSIAYHRNQTVVEAIKAWKAAHAAWMKAGKHASTRDIVAAEMELNDALKALASAGTDADRTEAPKCSPFCVNPWCPNRCWPPAATEPPQAEAGKPRRICYEHGPYERRCPACATEEPQPSAPERQPEVERDDGGEQE